MQYPEGKVEAISSTLSPAHPQWPGSVKGGPVPSLAHRTKMWKVHYDQAVSNVELYQRLIARMTSDPAGMAKEQWESSSKYDKSSLAGFNDHMDPAYWAALRSDYEQSLTRTKRNLQVLEKERPQ
jgi:hypothetical protein